jgi:UPF0716 family protein affecting phage T7 exclusion
VAAELLATPRIITGFIGVLLLIPPVRQLVLAYIRLRFEVYRSRMVRRPPESSTSKQPPEIIDV